MIGNLGADAEVREHNGRFVLNFSVCATESWLDANGNKQERSHWVRCSMWTDNRPKVAQYLTKGAKVFVEGLPTARGYVSGSEAAASLDLSLRPGGLTLIGSRTDGQQQYPAQSQAQQQQPRQQHAPYPNNAPQQTPAGYGPTAPQQQPSAPPPPPPFNHPSEDDLPF